MPGKAAKGLVTTGPKLRVDMPEMNVPTKMVSMLETFWSLRNTTGTSASEPTTEQLLKDYKMHFGISLGTISTLPSLPPLANNNDYYHCGFQEVNILYVNYND